MAARLYCSTPRHPSPKERNMHNKIFWFESLPAWLAPFAFLLACLLVF